MSLIVETGSGLSDAESYISVSDADAYHVRFGNAAWATATTDEKEIALRKAARYIDARYANRWYGQRYSQTQALDWPRSYVEDRDGYYLNANVVPAEISNANAILALSALTEDIYPDIAADGGSKTKNSIVVGPIEISEEFVGGAQATKYFRLAEDMVSRFSGAGGNIFRG